MSRPQGPSLEDHVDPALSSGCLRPLPPMSMSCPLPNGQFVKPTISPLRHSRTQAAYQVLRDPWSHGSSDPCVVCCILCKADGGSKYWALVAADSGSRGQLSSLCSSAAPMSLHANGARTCSWYRGSGPQAGVPLGLPVPHSPTSLSKPCGLHVRNTQAVTILSVSPHGHLSPG